jgi:hypothetical protein
MRRMLGCQYRLRANIKGIGSEPTGSVQMAGQWYFGMSIGASPRRYFMLAFGGLKNLACLSQTLYGFSQRKMVNKECHTARHG